jgi:hypothetical protein
MLCDEYIVYRMIVEIEEEEEEAVVEIHRDPVPRP